MACLSTYAAQPSRKVPWARIVRQRRSRKCTSSGGPDLRFSLLACVPTYSRQYIRMQRNLLLGARYVLHNLRNGRMLDLPEECAIHAEAELEGLQGLVLLAHV